MFNINCCTISVEKTAGKEELHGRDYLQDRHHRFSCAIAAERGGGGERWFTACRRRESRADGLRRSISTKGATLKYRPPPPLLLLPRHWQLCDPVNPSDREDLGRRAPRQERTKGDHLWPVWSNRQYRAGWRPASPYMRTAQRLHRGILVRGARLTQEIHTARLYWLSSDWSERQNNNKGGRTGAISQSLHKLPGIQIQVGYKWITHDANWYYNVC